MVDSLELGTILEAFNAAGQGSSGGANILDVICQICFAPGQLTSARTDATKPSYLKGIISKVVFMEVSGQIQDNLVEGSFALMHIMVEEDLSMLLASDGKDPIMDG